MSFQSKKIKEIIDGILDGDYVLPAIQRHFIWSHEQVITLFDSIMRGYPIGSFLFWRIKTENQKSYQFYDFIRHFHAIDNRYNKKIEPNSKKEITAILDGQQRLTSLLIGLKGSFTYKTPYMARHNPKAYMKRHLYINLIGKTDAGGYEFSFMSEDEEKNSSSEKLWYRVSNILKDEPSSFLISDAVAKLLKSDRERAAHVLIKLHQHIVLTDIISYYQEEEQDLDKVLNIFIRVNSGGTTLSYSDLLLSTATALWDKYDAREEIENLTEEIKNFSNGLRINSDFIMKACLVLADLDVRFLVRNFNRTNMNKIEAQWPSIKDSLLTTAKLVISYGYTQENLTTTNALLPIAYFIKNNNLEAEILSKNKHKANRESIISWLRHAILKKAFGRNTDTVLTRYRDVLLKNKQGIFPLEIVQKQFKSDITFSSEEVDELFDDITYGREAFTVLCEILGVQYNSVIHMDHLYPKSSFTQRNLEKWGFKSEEKQKEVYFYVNSLANLQLLDQSSNSAKSAKAFQDWVSGLSNSEKNRILMPRIKDYSPENFLEFCRKREENT